MSTSISASCFPYLQSAVPQTSTLQPAASAGVPQTMFMPDALEQTLSPQSSFSLASSPAYMTADANCSSALAFFQYISKALMGLIESLVSALTSMVQSQSSTPDRTQEKEATGSAQTPPTQGGTPATSAGSTSQPPGTDTANTAKLNQNFLWKPISDSDGKLAILCPARLTGEVSRVEVLSPDQSKVLAKGRYTGVGNGGREHYRFEEPGKSFPRGSYVRITSEDGGADLVRVDRPGRKLQRTNI